MAETPSKMVELGSKMPAFQLPEPICVSNYNTGEIPDENIVLIMFICNHCPYVLHIADGLSKLGYDYMDKPVSIFAINSNDPSQHEEDSPDNMAEEVARHDYVFPYLFDEEQEVARAFGAACTPDFFLYNREKELVYRGQFDDSRPGNDVPVTGESLRSAIDLALMGHDVDIDQKPSLGCNIKWKK